MVDLLPYALADDRLWNHVTVAHRGHGDGGPPERLRDARELKLMSSKTVSRVLYTFFSVVLLLEHRVKQIKQFCFVGTTD